MSEDFFVGYQPHQPSNMARFTAIVSGVLILMALTFAVVLTASQDEPSDATFEFGVYKEFSGIVRMDPYPRLETADGSTFLLVAPFKHGADTVLEPHLDTRIRLLGSLIQRGDLRMVEINPGSIEGLSPAGGPVSAGADREVPDSAPGAGPNSIDDPDPVPGTASEAEPAPVTVRGEIVDGKCWLGVMKPGRGTVHRACARLCIRGGVPALLNFTDAAGRLRTALLTTGSAKPIPDEILRWVARPVELTGSYDPDAAGGMGVFTVDARSIRMF